MKEKERLTYIKTRKGKLLAALNDAPPEKLEAVLPMVDIITNIEADLLSLQEQLQKTGYVEVYQNGPDQSGTKESTVSKSYSGMLKNYNNLMKTLLNILPTSEKKEAMDDLDAFLNKM